MKTPEKIKQSLECCRPQYDREHWITCYRGCSYTSEGCWCRNALHTDALSYIHQLELFVSQVSKTLCGKENATLEEVLHAASQLKSRLAQVERERDALNHDLTACFVRPTKMCRVCANVKTTICNMCERGDCFKWRGVCEENTKEELT